MVLPRPSVIRGLAAMGVVAVCALATLLLVGPGQSTGATRSDVPAAPSGSTGPATPVIPAAPDSAAGAPGRTPAASTNAGSTGATGATGGAGGAGGAGSEAGETLPSPASAPSSSAPGYRIPPRTSAPTSTPERLLGASLPRPAAALGRLVTGFPAGLTPPSGATIESSSVTADHGVLQVALVATGVDPDRALVHYRTVLGERGYRERSTRGVEDDPAVAFRRGADGVTIAVHDGRLSLFATLHAKPR